MTFELITIVAIGFAGAWAARRLTVVGFGVVSAALGLLLILWTLLAGADGEVGLFGVGVWLLFNVSYFLTGIIWAAFGGRLAQWRSRPISIKDAKSQ
jgi:hypothetical protein